MKLTVKLAASGMLHHPARALLTFLSIVASCCVIVWVVSGYDAMTSQFDDMASKALGGYSFIVVPDELGMASLPPGAAASLKGYPAVGRVAEVFNMRATIRKLNPDGTLAELQMPPEPGAASGGKPSADGASGRKAQQMRRPPGGRLPFGPMLVGIDASEAPTKLVRGQWLSKGFSDCGVLTENAARQLGAEVGDTVSVSVPGAETLGLKVAGIVEPPPRVEGLGSPRQAGMTGMARGSMMMRGPASSALYVPVSMTSAMSGEPSFLYVALKEGADPDAFEKSWNAKMEKASPKLFLAGVGDLKEGLQEGMTVRRLKTQAYTATGLSLLAAFFIIFSTLSMGVIERTRQFAMLRAIGLSRLRVASVIVVEGLFLALVGWLGGLASGWAMIKIASAMKPQLFINGASLGAWCVMMTGACAFAGSLAASLIPAWRATKVSPLDAMSPSAPANPFRLSIAATVAGVILLLVNPLVVFVLPMKESVRYILYGVAGCTAMPIGFILLAPIAVIVAKSLFSRPLALFLGFNPRLLSQQLSINVWRGMGTAVSLTVGLGLFMAFQIWGSTMLGPFVPGEWVPELLVAFSPDGVPASMAPEVASVKGVIPGSCLPLAVEQAKLTDDAVHSGERSSVVNQDNVIMIGMDAMAAFGGKSPAMRLDFVKGSAGEAALKLKPGSRRCLVPDHFAEQSGLGMGGRFKLTPPKGGAAVEYQIAGIVRLQGWHWMTKFSGLRRNSGRSAAMVFADFDDISGDFSINNPNFYWMDIESGSDIDAIGTAMQAIALRAAEGSDAPGRPEALLTTVSGIRERIAQRADGMIWAMCQLPLIILVISALGVVNTVMASVRSRRWEMGVLRSMGVTRSALARIVVAEGLLLGLVACVLSLSFGVMAGWCGVGISQYVSFFGGLHPSLAIPWATISLGVALTLALCLAAALSPAVSTGFKEPLKLLQAGRGGSF